MRDTLFWFSLIVLLFVVIAFGAITYPESIDNSSFWIIIASGVVILLLTIFNFQAKKIWLAVWLTPIAVMVGGSVAMICSGVEFGLKITVETPLYMFIFNPLVALVSIKVRRVVQNNINNLRALFEKIRPP